VSDLLAVKLPSGPSGSLHSPGRTWLPRSLASLMAREHTDELAGLA
jgi:hypothetical protein